MDRIPQKAKRILTRPLALGEQSGHHHSLCTDEADAVEMYERDGQIFVRVLDDTPLQHQEHKPHLCPSNAEGEVIIAEEVNDWGRAPVRD